MTSVSGTSDLKSTVKSAFQQRYGTAPTHVSQAPGRVNIIGEHTDYNDGFVLPAAINRSIVIAGRLRADDIINIQSVDYHTEASFTIGQLTDNNVGEWTRYPRGAMWILQDKGHTLQGMD